jgi:site-specific recombinase XerD
MALKIYKDYQQSNLRQNTIIGYRYVLDTFEELFGERDLKSVSSEDIFQFLELLTEARSQTTKRHRYAQLKTFFSCLCIQINIYGRFPSLVMHDEPFKLLGL